jgi:hypothetical protein
LDVEFTPRDSRITFVLVPVREVDPETHGETDEDDDDADEDDGPTTALSILSRDLCFHVLLVAFGSRSKIHCVLTCLKEG